MEHRLITNHDELMQIRFHIFKSRFDIASSPNRVTRYGGNIHSSHDLSSVAVYIPVNLSQIYDINNTRGSEVTDTVEIEIK